jgi:ABC-type Fe3+-siderophore transport system permease subunit
LLVFTVGAQIYRYRRISTPRERQQTKWVVFGFSIGIIGFVLFVTTAHIFIPPQLLHSKVLTTLVADTAIYGFLLLIPISIAIAILRSQLYDIDVLINRTLVYGSLTTILAALYAGLIIGLESLATVFTGETKQPIALVLSTLAIAALFQPVRHSLQQVIDRRFYRKKYDAQKTLAAFSTTLQSEVDLKEIRAQMLAVVTETMQPASVSLWLAQPERHPQDLAHHLEAHSKEAGRPSRD